METKPPVPASERQPFTISERGRIYWSTGDSRVGADLMIGRLIYHQNQGEARLLSTLGDLKQAGHTPGQALYYADHILEIIEGLADAGIPSDLAVAQTISRVATEILKRMGDDPLKFINWYESPDDIDAELLNTTPASSEWGFPGESSVLSSGTIMPLNTNRIAVAASGQLHHAPLSLNQFIPNVATLNLYTNDHHPSPASVLSDFIVPTVRSSPKYKPVTIRNHEIRYDHFFGGMIGPESSFILGPGERVYGYLLSAGRSLIMAERISDGPYHAGTEYTVNVKVRISA